MLPTENDQFTPIVSRYLHIESTVWGDEKKRYLIQYNGQLYNQDTAAAYDQLARDLRPLKVTPLFRQDGNRHGIILINGVIEPKPSNYWWNILLFVLTVISVMFAGSFGYTGDTPTNITGWIQFLLHGLPFAIPLMTILLCHEFGHYLAGRYHKTAVTLPYFIPFPINLFGTMGAFIQLKEPPKNRRILLDIGIAGPLAGIIVAIPILIYGLSISPVEKVPFQLPLGQIFEGNSILYLLLKYITKGQLLPQPFSYGNLSPIIYWIRYFFTGSPIPMGGMDVSLNPIAMAGWAGLFVTALNLIPAGQLDGGHIIFVLFGKYTNKVLPFVLGALILLGIVWSSWWFLAVLILLLGRFHAEPLDEITPLDSKRKALAVIGVIVFILIFMPVPIT